jgi:hypothetical protein
MKTTRLLLGLLVLAAWLAPVRAAERTSLRAILVAASNDKGPSDRRLAAYEPTLRSILRFESYRFLGEGSATLAVPAQGTLSLGQGHHLEIETEEAGKDSIRVRVSWFEGDRVLMRTVISQRPGVPSVLGGPRRGDGEVYAVIVIGR